MFLNESNRTYYSLGDLRIFENVLQITILLKVYLENEGPATTTG